MRAISIMVAASLMAPGALAAIELHPEVSARGWFFSIEGTIDGNTELDSLDFDSAKGQPEVTGALGIGRGHRIETSWLAIRRSERGTASGVVLGIIPANDDVAIDVEADYVRGSYGYEFSLPANFSVMPLLGLGYLREESDIRNESTGDSARQEDSGVFPIPGLEVSMWPNEYVGVEARASGIGTGRGHLIDVEGGVGVAWSVLFGGVGYRFIDFRFENDRDEEVANLELQGVWIRGGVRF